MPDRLRDEPGQIPARLKIGGLEAVRITVLLVVLVALTVMWAFILTLQHTADRIIDNQDQGTALLCRNAVQVGVVPLPARCHDPAVLRYMRR